MSTSVTSANAILDLIYRAIAWADIAQNDGSSPATNIDVALHTAAPVTSSQSSNEATFGGYVRAQIVRSAAGWTAASGGSLATLALSQFVECTSGSNTVTHVSTGVSGTIIHYGALSASRSVSAGIQPQFAAGALAIVQT